MVLLRLFVLALLCSCIVSVSTEPNCTFNSECGVNAYCQPVDSTCTCNKGFITTDSKDICNYKQKTKSGVFLLSFFVGGFGIDWFILARENVAYNVVGIFKLLLFVGLVIGVNYNKDLDSMKMRYLKLILLGCFGVWWLVDWIRILVDAFPDGQGHPLANL